MAPPRQAAISTRSSACPQGACHVRVSREGSFEQTNMETDNARTNSQRRDPTTVDLPVGSNATSTTLSESNEAALEIAT